MFKKWLSIENHYQELTIEKWLFKHPELENQDFQITEKIHGANFSIIAQNGVIDFASRNGILDADGSFYSFQEVMKNKELEELVNFLSDFSLNQPSKVYQLVGELYGGKIQKGVWYGKEKNFRWFGLYIDGELVSQRDADNILLDFLHLKVPVIDIVNPPEGLLNFIKNYPTEFKSVLTPEGYEEENICEGVVITPYNNVIKNQDSYFYIKIKNEKFKEKSSKPKRERSPKEDLPEYITDMILDLRSYICDARKQGLFSKMGELDDRKKLPEFASAYFQDIVEDFEKDTGGKLNSLEKSDRKIISKSLSKYIFKDLLKSV